jgi:exonuclease SbcC
MLLAQGGFDTFLKADAEQKSRILEQITGTGIYSEISRRVHERNRDEKEKLNFLQAETSGIVILEQEQEKEIQRDLETKQKQETELAGKSTETGKAIAWLAAIEGLKKEIQSLADEGAKLQTELEAFKPERGKLEQALKAASLDGAHATLTALRKQQSEDLAALKKEEAALPELETSAKTQAEFLEAAEKLTVKTKEELKAASPLIQKIRSLDQKIAEQAKAVSENSGVCDKEAAKIETDKQALAKEQEKRAGAEKTLEAAERYLKEHSRDEWLIGGLTGIEEQFGGLLAKQKEIVQKETDIENANAAMKEASKKLDAAVKRHTTRKKELDKAVKNLQQGKDALGELLGDKLLREYRAEKESLQKEKEYLARIAALEDHRTKLEEGKPCPLCGSTEHPFAKGNVPAPDEIDLKIGALDKLIEEAENQEAAIKKLVEAEASVRKKLNDSEKLEANAANDKKAAEKALAELKEGLEKLQTAFEGQKKAVYEKLQPLGIAEMPDDDASLLLESLKSRLNKWQAQVKEKAKIEKQLAGIDSEIKRLSAVIETQVKALTEKREKLEDLKKEHAAGVKEREELYGDKKPDDEDRRLNKAIADAEDAEKKAGALNSELQQKLTTAKTYVESLKKRIAEREPDLKKAETDFAASLEPAGFTDEKRFLEAKLTKEALEALSSRAKELDEAQTSIKARQKDRESRLAAETARKITDKPLEELEPQLKEYEESLKELRDAIAGLKHKLTENAAAKERIKEKRSAIESQKKECCRWEKLHALIGSADGKKYRNFAQGLTFELMVSHANRQLGKMTDRYLLIRDEEQPLELNVIDNYQAGEIRSTRNLSGGESFIVSLTLALGLSQMASRKVRVDSLFLDEGFGTLDEEALETALETLSGLQQDGKLIGIISHVSALKERISAQINITPVSGGRSALAGPGCKKL